MAPTELPLPDLNAARQMLGGAIAQLQFARSYTSELLDATDDKRWFEIPSGMFSNVAWQVGHITVSQYGLLLFRQRGRVPEDLDLIPGRFRKAYGRGSTPSPDSESQPTPAELRERMARVFDLGIEVVSDLPPDVLLEPVEMPYATYPVKLGAILFCPLHEHIHAGQIGMIRRGLGFPPLR